MAKHIRGRLSALMIACALFLTACGGSATPPTATTSAGTTGSEQPARPTAAAQPTENDTQEPTESAEQPSSGGPASELTVVISGGPQEGTYRATSEDVTCSQGLVGQNGWGNQYSIDTEDPSELSSVQLIVASTEAAEGETEQFMSTIAFGPILSPSASYDIAPAGVLSLEGSVNGDPQGSGSLHIERSGDQATVTYAGTAVSKDGEEVEVDVTIVCNEVMSLGDITGGVDEDEGDSGAVGTINANFNGELSGTFEQEVEGLTCSYGPDSGSVYIETLEDPEDAFAVEFYADDASLGIFQLEMVLPNATEAAEGGTGTFYLSVNDQSFYVENLDGSNDIGTVTLFPQGDGAEVSIDASDDSGNTATLTIICPEVVE